MQILTFQNIALTPAKVDTQIWLTSADLAKALGYAETDSVTKIYNRNKDEFTSSMTTTVKMTVVRKTGKVEMDNRIFSLRGCHLIAMFARTKVAKDFRKWVLDILDKEVGEPVITPIKTTVTDRKPLVQAVNLLVKQSDLDYRTVHKMVHQYMGVDSIEDITLQDVPKAVEYVHRLMLPDSLTQTQSYLKQEDAFVISKALCYALRYTEMAEKLIQQPKDNKNTIQYYFCNLCDINQGMFVVFSPNYQQDVHEAITLLREIAQHSLPLS